MVVLMKRSRGNTSFKWIFCWFIIVLMLVFGVAFYMLLNMSPMVDELVVSDAEQYLNEQLSEVVLANMQGLDYSDFFDIQRDNNGKITNMNSNSVALNKVKFQILSDFNAKISHIGDRVIEFPITSLIPLDIFANLGPNIPITISYHGGVMMDFKSDFTSAGINQTKHTVDINCVTDAIVVLGGRTKTVEIVSVVPILDNIIVGDVPTTFLQLDNLIK
ncbi:MAG: sporulation protein YunB [Clostridiales bacterium]|jgi:sporulation protein YunB|nr:sporulation protein YunB [Clostridiales bacterium]